MKLTKKVKLLIIPMVLLPITLLMLAFVYFGAVYTNALYGRGADLSDYSNLGNPVVTISDMTNDQLNLLQYAALNSPDKFTESDFLDKINKELEENNSFLLVRKENEWNYVGKENLDINILEEIAAYNSKNSALSFFLEAPSSYYIRCQKFSYSDGKEGAFYVVAFLGDTVKYFRGIIVKMILAILITLFLTSLLISLFMYRSFVQPIRILQEGTNKIKEGNLDFEVQVKNDDEFGELCESFNDMRVKLKQSLEMQLEAEQQNRELISNISHDLKTPMTSIRGYVEGIMDGVADTPEKMDKYIHTIYNKTNEMTVLLNELSLYTQINNNQIPYNFIPIDVDAYFRDCVEDLTMDLDRRGVELNYMNFCEPGVMVTADPEQIKRVINNIVFNAIKYKKDEKSRIGIRLRKVDRDKIRVEIEDNGKGIDEKDLPHIFERTYRADAARRYQGGSGLGLSICKKIIEDHGGSIWASSRKRVGTTVFFTLKIEMKER